MCTAPEKKTYSKPRWSRVCKQLHDQPLTFRKHKIQVFLHRNNTDDASVVTKTNSALLVLRSRGYVVSPRSQFTACVPSVCLGRPQHEITGLFITPKNPSCQRKIIAHYNGFRLPPTNPKPRRKPTPRLDISHRFCPVSGSSVFR